MLVCPACGEEDPERVKLGIERFGGTVEKFIGDAVMAVFGAPGRCGEAKALREGQAIVARLGASPVLAKAA